MGSFTIVEALSITKYVKFINKKEFAKVALDEISEIFIAYVTFFALISVHLDRKAQITSLFIKKVKISDKYSDFVNIFLEKKALVLPECTKLNKHAINLEKGKQLSYRPIDSLNPVKLETLKTYIKTHLKTGFI